MREASLLTQSYFDRECRQFGVSYKSLGWSSRHSQELRFTVASFISDWTTETRVLDVGCGHGDFFWFSQREKLLCAYTGIDFSSEMIAVARKQYPDGKFMVVDVLDPDFIEVFDVVIASGIANLRVPDHMGWIQG